MNETEIITKVTPLPKIESVYPAEQFSVAVKWQRSERIDKEEIVDLAPVIFTYKVYAPLRNDPGLFKTVHVGPYGSMIAWGADDAIDIAATTVERLASENMSAQDFAAFLKRHNFTYESAAAHLGISRRLVGYYASERKVPRYIALACAYLDLRAGVSIDNEDIKTSGVTVMSV